MIHAGGNLGTDYRSGFSFHATIPLIAQHVEERLTGGEHMETVERIFGLQMWKDVVKPEDVPGHGLYSLDVLAIHGNVQHPENMPHSCDMCRKRKKPLLPSSEPLLCRLCSKIKKGENPITVTSTTPDRWAKHMATRN